VTIAQNRDIMSQTDRKGRYTTLRAYKLPRTNTKSQ